MATSSTQDQPHNSKPVTGYPATAYPYPYPPPPPASTYYHAYQPPPTTAGPIFYNNQRQSIRGPNFVRRIVSAVIALFIILALIFCISWLVFRPQFPEFRLDSVSVSQLNATQSSLISTSAFALFVRNPNHKLSISYDKITASVSYNNDYAALGLTELPPFQQPKGNETTLHFEVSASGYVGEATVKRINDQRAAGSVTFGFGVFAWVRFSAGVWRMREHLMRVYCDPVKIVFSSNGIGSLMGQPMQCRVAL
ncbi:LEA_2 domain-containing protein [Cephalotus follicularis]|uniref:LEA_2 domain-containing protein n=1 Tax=Cephalotus follicularis TaxID=3775 RepID=A0A1Q3ANQ3_CEPFO|nr:LEA_2 domain-containing protein [Cephalotus follicularis]